MHQSAVCCMSAVCCRTKFVQPAFANCWVQLLVGHVAQHACIAGDVAAQVQPSPPFADSLDATLMSLRLLLQGAVVYVSGSADKMPQAVVKAFEDTAAEHGASRPETFVRRLEQSGRFFTEAWS